jgi:hypothetical protein
MAIVDLDKIIIRQTIIGINCPRCGGALREIKAARFKTKAIKILSFGAIDIKEYRCDVCKKNFTFLWKAIT